jgi:hypothetical protein
MSSPGKESTRCPCWQTPSSSSLGSTPTSTPTPPRSWWPPPAPWLSKPPRRRPRPATGNCWRWPTATAAAGCGRSRVPAAMAPNSHGSWPPTPSRQWSWTGPSGQPVATAPTSDPLDATRAAREALSRNRLAQPHAAGQPAALQVRLTARRSAVQAATHAQRQLHALVVAPDPSADALPSLTTPRLVSTCRRRRQRTDGDLEAAASAAQPARPSPPHPGPGHRDRPAHPGHHHPDAGLAARPAPPDRRGPDRGRHRPVRLVPPWPLPL